MCVVYVYVNVRLCMDICACSLCDGRMVCLYVCGGCVWWCTPVRVYICVRMSSCIWLCVTAITDSFVRSEFGNSRFRFVPVVDLIH